MSNDRTRLEARREGGTKGSSLTGIREWIDDLPPTPRCVAVFDTKIRSVRWLRGAAKDAQSRLRRRGYRPVTRPESFYVSGPAGPLLDGERQRAVAWGRELPSLVSQAPSVQPVPDTHAAGRGKRARA